MSNLRVGPTDEQYKLLTRKGVYPYEYMNSWERFKETQRLPIEAFHSKLSMSGIAEEVYINAQRVWPTLELKNSGEYHDLYLKTDVLLK